MTALKLKIQCVNNIRHISNDTIVMSTNALLPVFLWDYIRIYLSTSAAEKLIQVSSILHTGLPDLFYKAKFMAQCNQSCIVVYKSDVDPIALSASSSLKGRFWKYALEHKIDCKNVLSDIMNRVSYYNQLRPETDHIYYKIFCHSLFSYEQNEEYLFHHRKCSIEIIGIKQSIIGNYERRPYCECDITFRGIESLILRNLVFYNISIIVTNVNSLDINNCTFLNRMVSTAVSDVNIIDCKFNGNGHIVINSHNSTDITSIGCLNIVNIIKNQFCGMKIANIMINVKHPSEAPKINISNNIFAKDPKIKCGILNADLIAIDNKSLYGTVVNILNVNGLQLNVLA